ncbi:hypothetical protein MNBD_ALPHA03-259 [hydrothermal vent metagenome]|uniref:Uncharacterized protein n=1 Tax=hydrothermal vent metagenome TaxID=652676 RepID=A0A3B1AY50_9ZZZZ
MGKFWFVIIILILLAILGGGLYLMTVEIDPPRNQVEKILSDDRFPQ